MTSPSTPKSVSLAYEVGGDERIMDRATANMVWAEFIHRTTRPLADGIPDPQLHCHAVVFNCTWDPEEDRFKAGEFSNLVRGKGYYKGGLS